MNEAVKEIIDREYAYGFHTDLDTEVAPKGLDEDIVRVFPAAQAVVEDAPEDEDEESCYECGASLDDGEGYDGLCGNCADAAEPHSCENCGFTYSTGEGSGAACCENPVDAGW